jgi:hypothetical protein
LKLMCSSFTITTSCKSFHSAPAFLHSEVRRKELSHEYFYGGTQRVALAASPQTCDTQ